MTDDFIQRRKTADEANSNLTVSDAITKIEFAKMDEAVMIIEAIIGTYYQRFLKASEFMDQQIKSGAMPKNMRRGLSALQKDTERFGGIDRIVHLFFAYGKLIDGIEELENGTGTAEEVQNAYYKTFGHYYGDNK